MASEIRIPRLGWTMEEGTFVAWLKREGDMVAAGEPLFTLEGDKATQDVESIADGILRLPPQAPVKGDVLAVGALIGWLTAPGEEPPSAAPPSRTAAAKHVPAAATRAPSPPRPVRQAPGGLPPDPVLAPEVEGRGRIPPISPRAVRIAGELGIDWTLLRGTGRGGRIRARDVAASAAAGEGALTPRRKAIAARLLRSLQRVVPVTLTKEVDASALAAWRSRHASGPGGAPTVTELFIRLSASAFEEEPALNTVWTEKGLSCHRQVHMAIAVDTPRGLVAPVLRDAGVLGLREIAARSRDLIERARSGRLRPEDLEGATFTITSLGSLGIDAFTPIIDHPQTAILGLGRMMTRPAIRDGRVQPRELMWLSLTFDHRAHDGAPAARYLETLSRRVEDPGALLEEKLS